MARALAFAQGDGPQPPELEQLALVDRFGVAAVFGIQSGVGELRRMLVAEQIVRAWRAREAAESWVQWAQDNPGASRLLMRAEQAKHGNTS